MIRPMPGLVFCLALLLSILGLSSCRITQSVPEGKYLLKSNQIQLNSDQPLSREGELKDNLSAMTVQKPNTEFFGFPYKLWLYNIRYKKYQRDTSNFQLESKTVEPPVIYDSSTHSQSRAQMKDFLYGQGYFYAQIEDTTRLKGKKAYVEYQVNTGTNYIIGEISMDVADSTVESILQSHMAHSLLQRGREFRFPLLDEERSRITEVLKDYGYYRFSNAMIHYELDTLNKEWLDDKGNPVEEAIGFLAGQKSKKRPSLNILLRIQADSEIPDAFHRFGINRITVLADFISREDFRDSTMIETLVSGIRFRYHNYYIREGVLIRHIFLKPETYFAQTDYDLTISKLNELGVFQSVRITLVEDTSREGHWLNAYILMSPGKKYDFNPNLELSRGKNYFVGTAMTVSLRNRNVIKGANLFTLTASGGIEYFMDTSTNNLRSLTRNLGVQGVLDMPKFLLPIPPDLISRRNAPRTLVGLGVSMIDRIQYFRLINTSANLTYKWQEVETKSWEVSPAFVNLIRLPYESDSFQARKETNSFLANSYQSTFIEGEQVSFTFTDRLKKKGRNYSFVELRLEEAGALVQGLKSLGGGGRRNYAQYVKFDFNLQHFFVQRHSSQAFRFFGGFGIPYGHSSTLPYIKQYFVGGAYSIRGWRVRTLGPGSHVEAPATAGSVIDLTGDIKLEFNGEYRFDLISLFSGALFLKGAAFVDAGNIWLAQPAAELPGGEFRLDYLGRDLAVSTGLGLRVDIAGFFIIRLDLSTPIKYPSRTESGWVGDKLFSYRGWAKTNLVPQFGIGYPF